MKGEQYGYLTDDEVNELSALLAHKPKIYPWHLKQVMHVKTISSNSGIISSKVRHARRLPLSVDEIFDKLKGLRGSA